MLPLAVRKLLAPSPSPSASLSCSRARHWQVLEPIYHWPAKLTAADIPLVAHVGAAIAHSSTSLFLSERGQGYEYMDVRNAALTLIQLFTDLAWAGRPWGVVAEAVRTVPGQVAGVTVLIRQHEDLAFSCVEVSTARLKRHCSKVFAANGSASSAQCVPVGPLAST